MNEDTVFDRRTIARNIAKGKVLAKEYEQYLVGLADAAHKAVPIFSEEEIARQMEGQGRGHHRSSL